MFNSLRLKQVSVAGDEPKPSAPGTKRLGRALSFRSSFDKPLEAPAAATPIDREKTGAGRAKARPAPCSTWDDSDIAATATALLAWHDVDPGFAVLVKVDKGWITLSGHVDWLFQRDAVEQDVRRLLEVTGVTNTIEVREDAASRVPAQLAR